MSEEKFSKCEEGEKYLSMEFRVFGKKNWKKSSEKRFLDGNFTKFVFTGWAFPLICKFELQEKKEISKCFSVKFLKLEIFVAGKS